MISSPHQSHFRLLLLWQKRDLHVCHLSCFPCAATIHSFFLCAAYLLLPLAASFICVLLFSDFPSGISSVIVRFPSSPLKAIRVVVSIFFSSPSSSSSSRSFSSVLSSYSGWIPNDYDEQHLHPDISSAEVSKGHIISRVPRIFLCYRSFHFCALVCLPRCLVSSLVLLYFLHFSCIVYLIVRC